MKPTIKKVVEGVNMGLGHYGLAELLKKEAKIDVTKLTGTELVMCINGFGDKMKVIGAGGMVIGYLKLPGRQRIMKDALQYIPQTFGSTGFDYDKACHAALKTRLENKHYTPRRAISPPEAARAEKEARA